MLRMLALQRLRGMGEGVKDRGGGLGWLGRACLMPRGNVASA